MSVVLPNFLVIGAAKCGTTSVCDILAGHGDVFMCDPKEPNFFGLPSEQDFLSRREWYESLFGGATGFAAIGEGSVSSTRPGNIETSATRIREVIPAARLIYMVRHPIRRFESDWKMLRYERLIPAALDAAVEKMPSLISWAFYWKHLNVYRRLFSDEQMLVVFLEDFAEDPYGELERICRHIGVDPNVSWAEPERPRNTASGYRHAGRLGQWIREAGAYERAKPFIPNALIQLGKAFLTRPERHEFVWDPVIRRRLTEAYADDARRLLAFCGKPPDFWNLDD